MDGAQRQLAPILQNPAVLYYAWDHLGTVRLITNDDLTIQERHDYEPYGLELPPYVNQSANTHQFTGHERDLTSGFDYMHFRYFGSTMGRFCKPDNINGKLANPQSWNKYSYVVGNPVNFNDPTGHKWSIPGQNITTRFTYSWDVPPGSDDARISSYFYNMVDTLSALARSPGGSSTAAAASTTSTDTTTTVTLNSRSANIPGGRLLHGIGADHEWISTPDGVSVGMGTEEGVPQSDMPGVKTEVVDHSGQVPTSTQTFTGVDKAALATYTKIGTPTGRWIPGINDCNTWAHHVIEKSTPHNILFLLALPSGVLPIVLHNIVEYQDGSIHSPGGP